MSETLERKAAYAVCQYCSQQMTPGTACTSDKITIKGEEYDRVAYANTVRPEPHNCHDCGAPLGALHHNGCDMERCPRCGGQLISCDCLD